MLSVAVAVALPCVGVAEPLTAGASMARIRALIGDAACDDDSQCRTVAVGSKACGGPEAYLAWSTRGGVDSGALNAAVADHPAATPLDADRRISTCSMVVDPGAYCVRALTPQGSLSSASRGNCSLRGAKAPTALTDR